MNEERGVTTGGGTATGRRVRILLADDDDTVRFLLRELLETAGPYEVAALASDGREAVDTALRVRPEGAVLDLAMPRMSGLEAASELRRLLPDCRIVIHSSYSAAMMGQQAIDAGADAYVEKQIRPDHLLAALAGLFPSGEGLPAAAPSATGPTQRHTPVRTRENALLDALNPHRVGVVFTDAGGRVTSANAAAADLLGVPAHEIAGRRLADHLSDAGPAADQGNPVVAALTTGTSRSGVELDLVRPDGSRTRLSVSVRPLPDPRSSRPSGVVAVLEEITGR